ncbi:MAG: SMP-30/gluconolactonase/LRE family protein [Cyclobacteriaceae bacterium]
MRTIIIIILVAISNCAIAQQNEILFGKVNKIAGGFKFAEGPTSSKDGTVYFSDIPNDIVYKLGKNNELTKVTTESNWANGLFFSPDNELIACAMTSRQVVKIRKDGSQEPIATRFNGKRFTGPNDLWVNQKGHVFFTDPAYYKDKSQREIFVEAVYVVIDGENKQLISDLVRPNGLVGSIDGKYLYVVEDADSRTWRYNITENSELTNKTLFANVGDDGLTLDKDGRVYIVNKYDKTVDVFTSEGELINKVVIPETPTNVCFGGPNFHQLFITTPSSLYSVTTSTKGQRP